MFSQNPHISPRDLEEKINTQVLLLDEFVLSPLFNCVVLAQPLDLTDLLLAEHQEYRALWARHYLAMDPPYVLAQAGDVWQKASELATLNEAAAAGEVLSLYPREPTPQIHCTRRRCGPDSKAATPFTAGPGW